MKFVISAIINLSHQENKMSNVVLNIFFRNQTLLRMKTQQHQKPHLVSRDKAMDSKPPLQGRQLQRRKATLNAS